jgi:hypothetical protein
MSSTTVQCSGMSQSHVHDVLSVMSMGLQSNLFYRHVRNRTVREKLKSSNLRYLFVLSYSNSATFWFHIPVSLFWIKSIY